MFLTEPLTTEVKCELSRALGRRLVSLQKMSRGRNSSVYEIKFEPSAGRPREYVAKFYPDVTPGGRSRLDAEFDALRFLWDQGVRNIPEPILANRNDNFAVYNHVEGSEITSYNVTAADVDHAVEFLKHLSKLGGQEAAANLPAAADACFSARSMFDDISRRWARLLALEADGPQYQAMKEFLHGDLATYLTATKARCQMALAEVDATLETEIRSNERTLSPSDFGFHNAIRRSDGEIIYLDFEYFGWDDPAKMVSDFLLHPAMDLEPVLKKRFFNGCADAFWDRPGLAARIRAVYPVCRLKWCLLLLNEFVPEFLHRRISASRDTVDHRQLQIQQLTKAKEMLNQARNDDESLD